MDRQKMGAFVDRCQVVAGRVAENPSASAELVRQLLDQTPGTDDARAKLVLEGLTARMRALADAPPKNGDAPLHFRVAVVLAFLERRFDDPALNLTAAAEHAALSPTYLARLLKATTGATFLQHVRRLRVARAEQLLLTTTLSIKETAA